jgi:hypothetical protein
MLSRAYPICIHCSISSAVMRQAERIVRQFDLIAKQTAGLQVPEEVRYRDLDPTKSLDSAILASGSGQNGKDEEDCARTRGHGHAGGKGEREVQRPSKRRRASNWS